MTRNGGVFQGVELKDLPEVANFVKSHLATFSVWLFYGEMGSGKTTLIKEICRTMGISEGMSSPTFAIVNEYGGASGEKVFHFDFYRLNSEVEAYDIGVDEYVYAGNPCFVEWPEKIPSLIPPQHASVSIKVEDMRHRTIAISFDDGKEENRV
jgi:tRNA threonylcarbamoyladenosine biosynthesis protein TsaE